MHFSRGYATKLGLIHYHMKQALAELNDLKSKKSALEAEIQKYKDNDPEVLDKMKEIAESYTGGSVQ